MLRQIAENFTNRRQNMKIRGGLGTLLIIGIEESYSKRNLKKWKTFIVDGKEVKANTWYTH